MFCTFTSSTLQVHQIHLKCGQLLLWTLLMIYCESVFVFGRFESNETWQTCQEKQILIFEMAL